MKQAKRDKNRTEEEVKAGEEEKESRETTSSSSNSTIPAAHYVVFRSCVEVTYFATYFGDKIEGRSPN